MSSGSFISSSSSSAALGSGSVFHCWVTWSMIAIVLRLAWLAICHNYSPSNFQYCILSLAFLSMMASFSFWSTRFCFRLMLRRFWPYLSRLRNKAASSLCATSRSNISPNNKSVRMLISLFIFLKSWNRARPCVISPRSNSFSIFLIFYAS